MPDYSYCDWQPVHAHPTAPCAGNCGTHVDSAHGLCRSCRRIREQKPVDVSDYSTNWLLSQEEYGSPVDPLTIAAVAELDRRLPDRFRRTRGDVL